nr:MAG TPA: hypothetical protein [Caudoviricetes sp.]
MIVPFVLSVFSFLWSYYTTKLVVCQRKTTKLVV